VEPHIPRFADFPRWKGKRVLEIGCGIGTDTVNFCRAGAGLTALDLSPESLKITARRLQVYGLRADLREADAERLDFLPDDHFDLVYSFGVLHHTPSPPDAIAHCCRVLRPGSELRCMLYNARSYKTLWAWLRHGLAGRGWNSRQAIRYYAEAQTDCPIVHTYTDREVRELLRPLEVVSITNDHIFPYVISDYVQHLYRKVWYFRLMPAGLFKRLEQAYGWHKLIVARKPRTRNTVESTTRRNAS
jgi:ubiquinone/menaquinone biosynthesis C-methylase UbiE